MSNDGLLLTNDQYVHILDTRTGKLRLIEGAYKGILESFEQVYVAVRSKHILRTNQYCHILNPIGENGELRYGEQELRAGPTVFSLHPGEVIMDGQVRTAISLAESQGIYIKNQSNGTIRLEKGPCEVFLQPEEKIFVKRFGLNEAKALGLNLDDTPPSSTHLAPRIELNEDEIIKLTDGEETRILRGPQSFFLQATEHPVIFKLSGDTPKRPEVITTAKVRLGPDFLSDVLNIRTKDNAALQLFVRYKWRININEGNLEKVFLIDDFIGYASESIASEIRELAAKYDFEHFHENASDLVSQLVSDREEFPNGFQIFSIDIKQITPVDPQIADKLNDAISNNMDIYVMKVRQSAELEAEREQIQGEIEIESEKQDLIKQENENWRQEQVEQARADVDAELEKAKATVQAEESLELARIGRDVAEISEMIDALEKDTSQRYLALKRLDKLLNTQKSYIIPEDSKLWIPVQDNEMGDTLMEEEE